MKEGLFVYCSTKRNFTFTLVGLKLVREDSVGKEMGTSPPFSLFDSLAQ